MKSKKIMDHFQYAIEGIQSTWKSEGNMKFHVVVMCLVLLGGVFFQISLMEWMLCFLCFGTVLGAELLNTAIEATIDLVMPEKHELAKKAKDSAAGGVLVVAIFAFLIGCIIFLPKFISFLNHIFP